MADVVPRVGLGKSTIYERMARGTFPKPIRDDEGASVWWLESESSLRWRPNRPASSGSPAG